MKKISIICLILLLLMTPLTVVAANAGEDLSVTKGCNTLDSQVPVLGNQKIVDNVASAILYETTTDTLMYACNADARMSPASLVKILTALIAIEKGKMTDVVTVRSEVLLTLSPNAAVAGLVKDEVLTVKDLLYCMMVASGNDAAAVLAAHVMGSQQAFVAEMNRYAKELGCNDTVFTNVHGLHDDNQYTTARDTAKILARAVENEQFCEIFGAKEYTVQASNKSEARYLVSQNYLMNNDSVVIHYDSRVTGSRTAVADDRTRSLASVAKVGEMNLICIVMGSESVYDTDGYSVKVYGGYDETRKLFDYGFSGYKAVQIFYPGQVLLQRSVADGSSDVFIGTQEGVFSVIPANTDQKDLQYCYIDEQPLTAPIAKGQKLAAVQVWCGNICIGQSDLYALNGVTSRNTEPSISNHPLENNNSGKIALYIIGVAIVFILLFYVVLSVLRAIRIAKARKNSRRHSRNRRRSR